MRSAAGLAARVERLRARLPHGGAWWITRRQHVRYLTGVLPLAEYPATLLVTADAMAALWPGEAPAIAPDWVDGRVYDPWDGGGHAMAARSDELLRDYGLAGARLLFDSDSIPLALARVITPVAGADIFAEHVRGKEPEEVEAIRRNLAGNDAAFARIGRELRAGASDLDVAAWAVAELSAHAGAAVAYEGNIGLGVAGADPEAQPAGRVAAGGDLLFVDLYPMRDGYAGDSSRSFAIGAPDDWASRAHERLVRALEVVERHLEPGLPVAELDRLCREAAADGDGTAYPHHSGHGLGLFGQERPFIVPGSDDRLESGDVIAIEPGAYRPGHGGMRLEDVFLVTAHGCERLNSAPRELQVCG